MGQALRPPGLRLDYAAVWAPVKRASGHFDVFPRAKQTLRVKQRNAFGVGGDSPWWVRVMGQQMTRDLMSVLSRCVDSLCVWSVGDKLLVCLCV